MILIAVLGVLAALDIVTSLWGLSHGYPEAAPFMAALVDSVGAWAVAPMKVALALLIVVIIQKRITTRPRWHAWLLTLFVFGVPVVNNTILILKGA